MTTLLFDFEGKSYNFPMKHCTRCGGSGHYSYNPMNGTTCFGCNGRGVQVVGGKVSAAAAFYAEHRDNKKQVTVGSLVAGDRVLDTLAYRAAGGEQWVEVVSVDVHLDRECGWSVAPDQTRTVTAWNCTVHTSDGGSHSTSTNTLVRKFVGGESRAAALAEAQAMLPPKWLAQMRPKTDGSTPAT